LTCCRRAVPDTLEELLFTEDFGRSTNEIEFGRGLLDGLGNRYGVGMALRLLTWEASVTKISGGVRRPKIVRWVRAAMGWCCRYRKNRNAWKADISGAMVTTSIAGRRAVPV
jgi:hypothetical protein